MQYRTSILHHQQPILHPKQKLENSENNYTTPSGLGVRYKIKTNTVVFSFNNRLKLLEQIAEKYLNKSESDSKKIAKKAEKLLQQYKKCSDRKNGGRTYKKRRSTFSKKGGRSHKKRRTSKKYSGGGGFFKLVGMCILLFTQMVTTQFSPLRPTLQELESLVTLPKGVSDDIMVYTQNKGDTCLQNSEFLSGEIGLSEYKKASQRQIEYVTDGKRKEGKQASHLVAMVQETGKERHKFEMFTERQTGLTEEDIDESIDIFYKSLRGIQEQMLRNNELLPGEILTFVFSDSSGGAGHATLGYLLPHGTFISINEDVIFPSIKGVSLNFHALYHTPANPTSQQIEEYNYCRSIFNSMVSPSTALLPGSTISSFGNEPIEGDLEEKSTLVRFLKGKYGKKTNFSLQISGSTLPTKGTSDDSWTTGPRSKLLDKTFYTLGNGSDTPLLEEDATAIKVFNAARDDEHSEVSAIHHYRKVHKTKNGEFREAQSMSILPVPTDKPISKNPDPEKLSFPKGTSLAEATLANRNLYVKRLTKKGDEERGLRVPAGAYDNELLLFTQMEIYKEEHKSDIIHTAKSWVLPKFPKDQQDEFTDDDFVYEDGLIEGKVYFQILLSDILDLSNTEFNKVIVRGIYRGKETKENGSIVYLFENAMDGSRKEIPDAAIGNIHGVFLKVGDT